MIVVAGGTGRLGRIIVERLVARGETVRVMSRTATSPGPGEIVAADVRDRDAVDRAVAGARVVISAMSAFGKKGVSPRDVDHRGNVNLIEAAERHGVEQFILVSVRGASASHEMELARMKFFAEQALASSKLTWTILRPSTFIETFQAVLCAPLVDTGKTVVFGRARNPINFVSVHDVAAFVELALADPELRGKTLDIGGPENLSLVEFVDAFGAALGVAGAVKRIPRLAMRLLSRCARPFNPTFARMVRAGLVMDTSDMAFDAAEQRQRFPQLPWITVAQAARRDYASRVASRIP